MYNRGDAVLAGAGLPSFRRERSECFAFVCVPWLRLDGVGRGRRFALRLGVSLRTPYHRGIRYHV